MTFYCVRSLLLDWFKKANQLFAAQCIWWLASIIQFTEVLIYYHQYNIFPSDYIKNLRVTPSPDKPANRLLIPESDILELDIAV